jgi:hypothetical protein
MPRKMGRMAGGFSPLKIESSNPLSQASTPRRVRL